jgi:hypothetical protein
LRQEMDWADPLIEEARKLNSEVASTKWWSTSHYYRNKANGTEHLAQSDV